MRGDGPNTSTGPRRDSWTLFLQRAEPLRPYAGPTLILVVGALVLAWSWDHGPDALIDFGRELYVPWQITEGARLYSDLLYLNGPLSPHLNALFFSGFGVSLRVLMAANATIALAIALLVYALLTRAGNRLAATVGGLAFVSFIAFTQLGTMGNYNFLTPYSHEVTHGLGLGLLSLWLYSLYPRYGEKVLAGAGFALGLVFLTKVEIFLATAGALGLGVVIGPGWKPGGVAPGFRSLVTLAWATALPVVLAFLALWLVVPAVVAYHGLADPWIFVLNTDVTSLEFYRWVRGTDQLEMNLQRMLLWLGRYALFAVPVAVLAFLVPARPAVRTLAASLLFLLLVFTLGPGPYVDFLADPSTSPARELRINEWPHATRGFPVVLLLMAGVAGVAWQRARREGRDTAVPALRIVLIAFAFLLLLKIFFNVRLHHYGFALALPALLVVITALLCWIPRLIDHYGGAGRIFGAASLAVLLVADVNLFQVIEQQYSHSRFTLGRGGDAFRTGQKAIFASRALEDLQQRVAPGETLAVFPEGIMLNYLARRASSTPHVNFMPPEVILYGEERILSDMEQAPPDYIAIVHKDTTEYGFPLFGSDYGNALHAWILENYEPVRLIGRPPLRFTNQFGIEIRRRTDPVQSSSNGG